MWELYGLAAVFSLNVRQATPVYARNSIAAYVQIAISQFFIPDGMTENKTYLQD